jgi:hypothetical protein
MTQWTSQVGEGVGHVGPDEISQKFTIVPTLGILAAFVGLVSVCVLPFGYIPAWQGVWDSHRGGAAIDFRAVLLVGFLSAALAVSLLGLCAGVAAGAGKTWSRAGLILYADLSIVLSIVGVLPFYLLVLRTPVLAVGQAHAVWMLVVVKYWIVELPLSIAILYCLTRAGIEDAFRHPGMKSPDRSLR